MTHISNIEPAFGPDGVAILMSTDANYAPYLAATLASIIDHASPGRLYDVVLFASGLPEADQAKIRLLADGVPSFSVRFFDVRDWTRNMADRFRSFGHISSASYYRMLAPSIFASYDKLIYLDCDTIAVADLAGLFDCDLGGQAAGVVRDFFVIRDLARLSASPWARQLSMRDIGAYFNAGLILMNLAKMREDGYEDKWFACLKEVERWTRRFHDQDILNHTLEGHVRFLDAGWNSLAPWSEAFGEKILPGDVPEGLYDEYRHSAASPKVLHFASKDKPWDFPQMPLADKFWEYAFKTPYGPGMALARLKRLAAENDRLNARFHFPPPRLKHAFYILMGRLAPAAPARRYQTRANRLKARYGF